MKRRRKKLIGEAFDNRTGTQATTFVKTAKYKRKYALVGFSGGRGGLTGGYTNPAYAFAQNLQNALDPVRMPGRVRTMADMTPAELAELAALLPPKVRPIAGKRCCKCRERIDIVQLPEEVDELCERCAPDGSVDPSSP